MTPPTSPLPPASDFGRLGLGGVTFGREIDEAAAFALMDHAAHRGIRLFDTAAAYGAGASERIVGRWFATRRPAPGAILVATKLLPPYTAAQLEAGLAASRQRLAPAPIAVLYLHRWDESAAAPETLATLHRFVAQGEVARLGASNYTAAQLERTLALQSAAGLAPFRVLQNNHNFAVRDVDPALRRLCAAAGLALVTYSPLGAGFLTGKHRTGVVPGSRFDVIPGHQRIYFTETARAASPASTPSPGAPTTRPRTSPSPRPSTSPARPPCSSAAGARPISTKPWPPSTATPPRPWPKSLPAREPAPTLHPATAPAGRRTPPARPPGPATSRRAACPRKIHADGVRPASRRRA